MVNKKYTWPIRTEKGHTEWLVYYVRYLGINSLPEVFSYVDTTIEELTPDVNSLNPR